MAEDSKNALDRRFRTVFHGCCQEGAKPGALSGPMMSNLESVRALDGSIYWTTRKSGIKQFVAERHGLCMVQRGEIIYLVDAAELPPTVQLLAPDRTARLCVETLSGDTSLMVRWGEDRPSLWVVADMGSKAWPSFHALFQKLGVRGGEMYDPLHRYVRQQSHAITRARLSVFRTEWAVVLTYLHGPWDTAMNFRTIQGALKEFFHNFDASSSLWKFCYSSWVDATTDGKPPAWYGTVEHLFAAFEEAKHSQMLMAPSVSMKVGRWFSFEQKARAAKQHGPLLLLALLYKMLVKGAIVDGQSLATLVMDIGFGMRPPAAAPPAGAASSSGDIPPAAPFVAEGVAASNAEIEKMKRVVGSNSTLVVRVLANRLSSRLKDAMLAVFLPVEVTFLHVRKALKTQMGVSQYYVEQSKYGGLDTMQKLWAVLLDQAVMFRLGLVGDFAGTSEADIQDQYLLAETLVDLIKNYISVELDRTAYHVYRPPMVLMALLDRDETVRRERMQYLRAVWDAVKRMLLVRHDDRVLSHFKAMLWPFRVWDMEMLVACAEADFRELPTRQKAELQDVCRSFGSSDIAETAHGVLVEAARQSKGHQLGRISKYHRLLTSSLMEDHDRKAPRVENETLGAGLKDEKVDKKDFRASSRECSLGDTAVMDALLEKEVVGGVSVASVCAYTACVSAWVVCQTWKRSQII